MKINKLGHCCLVVEVDGKRVMTDPGSYIDDKENKIRNEEKNIDLIVITHEHPDHLHVESLKIIVANNPNAVIVTNTAVGKILDEAGVTYSKLEDGQNGEYAGVYLEAHGEKHEEIYEEFGQVQNTGYFIGRDLFYPGDAFTNPNKKVDILALPIAGPWMRIKDAIDYTLQLKPRICFPVHEGMMMSDRPGPIYRIPNSVLPKNNIQFKVLEIGKEEEI